MYNNRGGVMAETKEKDYQLSDLIIDACDTLDHDWKDIQKGNYDQDDTIHEIADTAVPIYYWDIAQYAAWNTELMQEIPECGTEQEPYKQIQLNIYEAIVAGLYEHVAEKEQECKHLMNPETCISCADEKQKEKEDD